MGVTNGSETVAVLHEWQTSVLNWILAIAALTAACCSAASCDKGLPVRAAATFSSVSRASRTRYAAV